MDGQGATRRRGHAASARLGGVALARTRRMRVAAVLVGVLCSLAIAGQSAWALSQRGHVFDGNLSFGGRGKTPGLFERPDGVAVRSSTGEVYVADRGNNRVQEFAPNSEGELHFVRELKVPYPTYVAVDNSTSASDPSKGDVYVVGAVGEEKHEAKPERFVVYKFNEKGEPVTKITKIKLKVPEEFEEELELVLGIAVDSTTGSLFVYQEEEIFVFNDEEKNKGVSHVLSQGGEGRPGIAVDSHDDFYVGTHELSGSFSVSEEVVTQMIEEEDEEAGLYEEAQEPFAASEAFGIVAELESVHPGKVFVPELDPEDTTAVAVNPSSEASNEVLEANDVYIVNRASIAGEDASTVAQFNSRHELLQRFSAPGLKDGLGVAVDSKTGTVYVADGQSDSIDVFVLEPKGAPKVTNLSSCSAGAEGCSGAVGASMLRAEIDPVGSATTYHFEYGDARCSVEPAACRQTPEEALGGGSSGYADFAVSAELPALAAGVWHYRVVASNAKGTTTSEEQTFTVAAAVGGLPDNRQWQQVSPVKKEAQPLVYPAEGAAMQASADGGAITYEADGPMGGEVEGNRNLEYTQVLSTRGPSGWSSRDLDTPNTKAAGFHAGVPPEYRIFSTSLSLALLEPYPEGPNSGPLAEPPLSPTAFTCAGAEVKEPEREKTIYLRADQPKELLQPEASEQQDYECAATNGKDMGNPGYLPLVNEANAPGLPFGAGLVGKSGEPEGIGFANAATPDLSHGVVTSGIAKRGLYEWGPEGALKEVSVLEEEEVHGMKTHQRELLAYPEASVGGAGHDLNTSHAISDNGALVFWSTEVNSPLGQHLYVRDTQTSETLQLDAVQGGTGHGTVHPVYETASADGSRVFFADSQRLVPGAKALEERPDLYVAELHGGSGAGKPLTATLVDLTKEGVGGESADVQTEEGHGGGVLGANESGSVVYYVADGVLGANVNPQGEHAAKGGCLPGASPGELPAATTCNLYVSRYEKGAWGTPTFIARLSLEDSPDWGLGGSGTFGDPAYMSARVSPDGQYLAFMSNRSLTGYDNANAPSEEEVERHEENVHLDEEVFLYNAESQRLVCASCDPSGARPHGVFDAGETNAERSEAEGEGGQLVDRPEIWAPAGGQNLADPWLAASVPGWVPIGKARGAMYQARYVSDSGRLFFNSPDHLVPAATGEKEKVYEYEPEGVGTCQSTSGCVGLISSGDAEHEAAFLDASENGDDVFFVTASQLVQQDADESFDVYDAHVCESASPCLPAPAAGEPPCASVAECRPGSTGESSSQAPASVTAAAVNTVAPRGSQQVLSEKEQAKPAAAPAPKPLTRAQKLARALHACKKYKHKSRRLSCEKQARKLYGPKKVTKAGKRR
jgi:DNA-binding beta-propeller fold protein YncE